MMFHLVYLHKIDVDGAAGSTGWAGLMQSGVLAAGPGSG